MEFQENTVEVGFGFRNLQTARVFAEDSSVLETLAPQSGEAEADLENVSLAEEDGLGVVRMVIHGDSARILQCFDTVQRYGGWLRGELGGDPESTSEAIGHALERGWKPGLTEENRPGEFGYAASSLVVDSTPPAEQPDSDMASVDDDGDTLREEEDTVDGTGKRNLVAPIAGLLALAGIAVGGFLFLKNDSPPSSTPSEASITDPVTYCKHAAALLAEAFPLLPEPAEVEFDTEIDSVEFFDKLRGTSYSPMNPKLWSLAPGLDGLVKDPWENPYRLLFSETETGFSLQLRSFGPDGIDDGGENDDLAIPQVEIAAVETRNEDESGPTNLLAAEIVGAAPDVGSWTNEDGVLISPEDEGMAVRGFDVATPDEYELEFTVERLAGNHAFVVGFPARGKTVTAVFDAPLRKGAATMRGIGISRVVQRQGSEDDSPEMLPAGLKKKVYVKVGSDDIRVGIRDEVEFVWEKDDAELGAFPESFAEAAATSSVFVGNWNTSFAIHSAEILPTVDPGAANGLEATPLPLSPAVELPPAPEFPRSGVVPLGWKEFGTRLDDGTDSDSTEETLIAVLVELDTSQWTATVDELEALTFAGTDGEIPLENVDIYKIGSFQIRVGGEIQTAGGAVWRWRTARTADQGVVSNGPVSRMEEDGQALLVAAQPMFAVARPDPTDRAGRDKLMIWARFPKGDGHRSVHVKVGSEGWRRVPDRIAILPTSPVPEDSD